MNMIFIAAEKVRVILIFFKKKTGEFRHDLFLNELSRNFKRIKFIGHSMPSRRLYIATGRRFTRFILLSRANRIFDSHTPNPFNYHIPRPFNFDNTIYQLSSRIHKFYLFGRESVMPDGELVSQLLGIRFPYIIARYAFFGVSFETLSGTWVRLFISSCSLEECAWLRLSPPEWTL